MCNEDEIKLDLKLSWLRYIFCEDDWNQRFFKKFKKPILRPNYPK